MSATPGRFIDKLVLPSLVLLALALMAVASIAFFIWFGNIPVDAICAQIFVLLAFFPVAWICIRMQRIKLQFFQPYRPRRFVALVLLPLTLCTADIFVFVHWRTNDVIAITCITLFVLLMILPGKWLLSCIPMEKHWHDVPIKTWMQSAVNVFYAIMMFLLALKIMLEGPTVGLSKTGILYVACGIMGLLAAYLTPRKAMKLNRTKRRAMTGQCITCGYDLRASKDRCPECGSPFNPSHPSNSRALQSRP